MFFMASLTISIKASFISTSIVTFMCPFFSSAITSPPFEYLKQPLPQNSASLIRRQIQINNDFIVELSKPSSSCFIVKDQIAVLPISQISPNVIRDVTRRQRLNHWKQPHEKWSQPPHCIRSHCRSSITSLHALYNICAKTIKTV